MISRKIKNTETGTGFGGKHKISFEVLESDVPVREIAEIGLKLRRDN